MADLNAWAAPRLSQLLPLDPDSLSQAVPAPRGLTTEAHSFQSGPNQLQPVS
jgi:hypothetical protein